MSRLFPSSGQVSLSNSPCNDYSGLISFRIDWFDLLAIHRTLKSLLQHHSSKASILQHSAFFIVQLSHPYVTTGKIIALAIWTFLIHCLGLSRASQNLSGGKEPACQYKRHKKGWFSSWARKIPWRRKWQPTPVFLPGEPHGQRSLAGYSL